MCITSQARDHSKQMKDNTQYLLFVPRESVHVCRLVGHISASSLVVAPAHGLVHHGAV